ncbi:VIT1/CCC1 transporter family protein [Antrihabitans cavernicola]|uniref:Rubrerythrin family protein n=1 Tax=Antrihabitans cavernicola TaxID=2495913 RepID=A0A5A7SDR3_9NOCA|nr:VIT1/CCC1 transporter family protein [Spelaeibacter cavernicola]KAA0024290.1 rubrerythrin family protein [Spelaeibacter cavernicola]
MVPDAGSATPPENRQAPSPAKVRRWRRRLADEREEARIYRNLAARRSGEEQAILRSLADAEERHAAHWETLLGADAGRRRRGNVRARILVWLARHFGSVFVLALVQRAESQSPYGADTDATATMAADEQVHEEVVRALAERGRSRISGSFRAAVFGANDGLVSNLSLVLGVSGGGAEAHTVLLSGVAGLLAGALSMGAGEYVSVRSQRELLAASTPTATAHTAVPHLDVNANELALVYRARGMSETDAQQRADALLQNYQPLDETDDAEPDGAHDVVGTGLGAALSSFAFFASGALIPVLPFLFGLDKVPALVVATILVAVALLLTGAVVGLLSGGPPLRRGLRQLTIGLGAAAITYLLGLLFGATLG